MKFLSRDAYSKQLLPKYLLILVILCFLNLHCESTDKRNRRHNIDKTIDRSDVLSEGREITQTAFNTLSSNLQEAMAKGGVEYAISFCNIEADPLTDSLSKHVGVEIRRASHKARKPANHADSVEMKSIEHYLRTSGMGTSSEARLIDRGESIYYHAPIRINSSLCLNCHGMVGQDISESTLHVLDSLYPRDRARGFSMGELRGIWSVKFPKDYFLNRSNEIKQ